MWGRYNLPRVIVSKGYGQLWHWKRKSDSLDHFKEWTVEDFLSDPMAGVLWVRLGSSNGVTVWPYIRLISCGIPTSDIISIPGLSEKNESWFIKSSGSVCPGKKLARKHLSLTIKITYVKTQPSFDMLAAAEDQQLPIAMNMPQHHSLSENKISAQQMVTGSDSSSLWFRPIWNILVKLDHLPR